MNTTRRYTDVEKLKLITEYMHTKESREAFQMRYGLGHCTLSRWMTKYGLTDLTPEQMREAMLTKKKEPKKGVRELALEAKIAQLEQELKDEKTKSLVYSSLVETAKEELGIDLRKKYGAKQ